MKAEHWVSRQIGYIAKLKVNGLPIPYTAIYRYLKWVGEERVTSVGMVRYHAMVHGAPPRRLTDIDFNVLQQRLGKWKEPKEGVLK